MAGRNVIARESSEPKWNFLRSNGMCTRVRGRHPTIQGPRHGHKDANRPQRITASAFPTDRPLFGRRRDQGLSDRCLCTNFVREGNPVSDPPLFNGSNKSDEGEDVNVIWRNIPITFIDPDWPKGVWRFGCHMGGTVQDRLRGIAIMSAEYACSPTSPTTRFPDR